MEERRNINLDRINYSTNLYKRKGFPHIFGDIFINVLLFIKELWKIEK